MLPAWVLQVATLLFKLLLDKDTPDGKKSVLRSKTVNYNTVVLLGAAVAILSAGLPVWLEVSLLVISFMDWAIKLYIRLKTKDTIGGRD